MGVNGPGGQSFGAYIQGPDAGQQPGIKLIPAGMVQGHQAWWESEAPGSASAISDKQLMLDWNYEPNAWATVIYSGHADAAAGVTTLKVADSLKIGPTHPSPMPFQLSPPAGLHVDAVSIGMSSQYDARVGDASIRLCLTSPCFNNGGLVVSQTATKWFSPAPGLSSLVGTEYGPPLGFSGSSEHVTVDGHSAQLWANAIEAWLSFTDGGSQLTVTASGAEYQALGGRDGFLAFCRSVTWLGTNPADWTTDVVR